MKNKIVGYLVIGIALIVGILTYIFTNTLEQIHSATCTMGPTCAAYQSINFQQITGIIFTILLVLVGLYLVFFGQERVEVIKKIREKIKVEENKKDYSKILPKLSADERKIAKAIIDSHGAIFQSELAEKTGFDKVKVTRILDRLEGQSIIERRRRGMTNIVLLK